MLAEPTVKIVVANASQLSSYMRISGLNSKLKSSLKKHTTTRWNSVYMMFKEIIANYPEIVEVLNLKQKVAKKNDDLLKYITCLRISELIELKEVTYLNFK